MLDVIPVSKNTTNNINNRQLIYQASTAILPLAIAVIPWGILCGSLAIKVGLTPFQAQLMSLFVFAGAAQLASLTLLGTSGALSSILSSTFIISSRHLLYSAVFREHVRNSSMMVRYSIAFFLTDEMFAVTCAYLEKNKSFSYLYALSAGITFYLVWNCSTFVGIVAGQFIPNIEDLGLEFAIAATFIAIVTPSIKRFSTLMSVLASGISVCILSITGIEHALIIATCIGMATGFLTTSKDKNNG